MIFPIDMLQGALFTLVGSLVLAMTLIQILGTDSIWHDLFDTFLFASGSVFCILGWLIVYLGRPLWFGVPIWG